MNKLNYFIINSYDFLLLYRIEFIEIRLIWMSKIFLIHVGFDKHVINWFPGAGNTLWSQEPIHDLCQDTTVHISNIWLLLVSIFLFL